MSRIPLGKWAVALLAAAAVGCVWVRPKVVEADPATIQLTLVPVRAHLADGTMVLFQHGVRLHSDTLWGGGVRLDYRMEQQEEVSYVPLADVVGMEAYDTETDPALTFITTSVVFAAGVAATVALLKAVFGSCPTVYVAGDQQPELQAELFSYSIAAMYEARDVDQLRVSPGTDGIVRLEIRNEALETHRINHLELLEVVHRNDETIVPDAKYGVLKLGPLGQASSAVDRAGRNVLGILARADREAYSSAGSVVAAATVTDMEDHITVAFPAGGYGDSAAVFLELRNSLLNTVLLYDVMLAPSGLAALDWMGRDLEEIESALELAEWYSNRSGMRVSVLRDGSFHTVARIADAGPLAWRRVAVPVPVQPESDTIVVRLSFVPDQWRIDRVAMAEHVERVQPRVVPLARVLHGEMDAGTDTAAVAALRYSDDRRLETRAGQRFFAEFDVGAGPDDFERTFLLASQGYYTEWVRPSWARGASRTARFHPSDEAMLSALQLWAAQKEKFEQDFYGSAIPVR